MDIPALLVCTLLVQVCCGLGLYVVARSVPGFACLRWWAWAFISISLGLIIAMRQDWLVARVFALAGGLCLTQGVAEHLSPRTRFARVAAMLMAAFVLLSLAAQRLPYADDSTLVLFALAFAAALLPGAWIALSRASEADRAPRTALGALLAGITFIVLLRAVVAPLRGVAANPWTEDPLRFGGLAFYLVLASALAFVFIWVVAARMRRQFETESLTDALTGVLNRRALDAVLAREFARRGAGEPLALLTIDMDDFKSVNDTHGHPAGDRLLAAAAQGMASSLRSGDTLARFGGEEFIAVLPGRGLDHGLLVAERLRARVAALAVAWEGRQLHVTASVGVAAWEPGDTAFSLLGRADRNLYAAKRAGRNRVCAGEWTLAAGGGR